MGPPQKMLELVSTMKTFVLALATLTLACAHAAPPEGISTATAERLGKLDPALAAKIAGATGANSLTMTEASAEEGGSRDLPDSAGVLIGFEFLESNSNNMADIRSLRAIYLTSEGVKEGKARGELSTVTNKVLARAGYAVGGIAVHHNERRIQGIQVIFMKINPATGKLDTSAATAYKSMWFGSRPRGKARELGGDGRLVVGIFGKTGADCDTIGLIQMPN